MEVNLVYISLSQDNFVMGSQSNDGPDGDKLGCWCKGVIKIKPWSL